MKRHHWLTNQQTAYKLSCLTLTQQVLHAIDTVINSYKSVQCVVLHGKWPNSMKILFIILQCDLRGSPHHVIVTRRERNEVQCLREKSNVLRSVICLQ